MRGIDKDMKQLFSRAISLGWIVQLTRGGHVRLTPPEGWTDRAGKEVRPLVTSCTASDYRARKNFISQLRRAGVPIPHR